MQISETVVPNKKDYEGMVEFHGKIDINQFYSLEGRSDADTIHLMVDSIRFRPTNDSEWIEKIQIFNGAYVNVYGDKVKVIKNNKVTVRLQGIDATELHLLPRYAIEKSKLTNEQKELWRSKDYRQYWSVRSTSELVKFFRQKLEDAEQSHVSAYVYSRVDTANDLFDRYARLVGDIVVNKGEKNVNQWLVEKGWALPTFYETMSAEEISNLSDKAKSARGNSRGMWDDYSKNLVIPFDFDLFTSRKPPFIDPTSDKGKFILPKIYRRQVNYEVNKRAKIITDTSLKDYIKSGKDKCYETKEFFSKGTKAKIHYLDEYITKTGKILNLLPSDLIFKEALATLRNSKGKEVLKWV